MGLDNLSDFDLKDSNNDLGKTEYRIITYPTFCHDRFLQFKSTAYQKNFPDFWNSTKVEAWRFIPEELSHIHWYMSEDGCPTSLSHIMKTRVISCFSGHEDYGFGYGVTPFTRKYPDIRKYFEEMNAKRDRYLKKEAKVKNQGTTYL